MPRKKSTASRSKPVEVRETARNEFISDPLVNVVNTVRKGDIEVQPIDCVT